MSAPRVTVAVTQRESFGHTKRSLDSLYAAADAPFELVYFDAGSPKSVQRLIDAESRRRGFKVMRFPSIIPPNATHNLVLAAVESEFIAFVDNDVIFKPGWLRQLLACADETGADIVGALIFMVHPPFTYVHFAGGDISIERSAAGRTYRETFPLGMQRIDRIANPPVRSRTGKVEFHCALARRSIFERIGPFDEAITSLCEHADTSMRVQQAGGLMMLEPAAEASYLSPKPFPFDIQSIPFYFERWSRRSNRASIDHFRAKWQIPADDYLTAEAYYWATDRRWLMFRYLRLRFLLRALRKLRRIARKSLAAVSSGG
jgi:GT2 family glycosyltransferase